jgi:hypothetical protein
MVVLYLVMVEVAKRGFYRWYGGSEQTGGARRPVARLAGA